MTQEQPQTGSSELDALLDRVDQATRERFRPELVERDQRARAALAYAERFPYARALELRRAL